MLDLTGLTAEASISGDEAHDLDSNILHGSLNVRIHRRGDSRDNAGASGPCESPCYPVHITIFKFNYCWRFLITMIHKIFLCLNFIFWSFVIASFDFIYFSLYWF